MGRAVRGQEVLVSEGKSEVMSPVTSSKSNIPCL